MSTADERAPPEPEHSWAAAGSNWTLGNDNQHSTPNIKRSSTSSTSQPGRCPSDTQELHVVGWDGPDDPKNPMNWPLYRKVMILSCVSMITLLTQLGSSLFTPGVADVMIDFQSDNIYLAAFVVSVYVLGYCFGPLVIAPLSELYGRVPLYHMCNLLYTIFTVACAVAPGMASLVTFRFLAGVAGSCPLTLGAGSIADMVSPQNRGAAMGAWAMGSLLGPVIGPVGGGFLTQARGWRWTFGVLAIAGGTVSAVSLIVLRESCAYVLLDRKAHRLRRETGHQNLRSALDAGRTPRDLFIFSIVRPTKMLFLSPIVFLLSAYVAVIYGYLYLLFTTIPGVFEDYYGFSQGSVGLAYLGIGCGSLIGLCFLSAVSDRLFRHLTERSGGISKPEYRLPPMIAGTWVIPLALFCYGWTVENHTHWIWPIIGTSFLGVGMLVVILCTLTYLVDAYTTYAASAVAANTVFRSLCGAILPLAGNKMYASLGIGWGNSVLGFIALALAPLPWFFYLFGERIRQNSRYFPTST